MESRIFVLKLGDATIYLNANREGANTKGKIDDSRVRRKNCWNYILEQVREVGSKEQVFELASNKNIEDSSIVRKGKADYRCI